MSKNINKIIERARGNMEPEYRRGDIYYIARSGYTVGSEQEADRPAVIVSNDMGNKHSGNVTVVYLTTQPKTELPTHVFINSAQKVSIALCEYVVSVSKERIRNYFGKVTEKEMQEITEALAVALQIEPIISAGAAQKGMELMLDANVKDRLLEAEEKIKETEETYKATIEELEKQRKETAFYKMMYEDALEKVRRFALGGGITQYAE